MRAHATARVVADLVQARERDELRAGAVRDAAQQLSVGERTVWRWVAPADHQSANGRARVASSLSDELRDAYLRLSGNVAALYWDHEDGWIGNAVYDFAEVLELVADSPFSNDRFGLSF